MKKRVLAMFMAVLLVICSIHIDSSATADAKETFKSLNPVIDVGDTLYTQYDAEGNSVYDLKKSGTGTTVVYERILPEYTANKVWTTDGRFIDNTAKKPDGNYVPHGATAPDKYIPVKAGEEYFIKAYGIGDSFGWAAPGVMIRSTPVLFLNDKNEVVSHALTGEFGKSKSGRVVIVPEGATRMHLTNYNQQNMSVEKILRLSDAEFNKLPGVYNKQKLESQITAKYDQYKKDPTVYKNLDQAYITFVNDDSRSPMDQFADVFISKKIPLVLATMPSAMIDNASSQKETRLEVARRVVDAGGEVMAHYAVPLTKDGLSDYNTMFTFFVRNKQWLQKYGFEVNGVILSGGLGQVTGDERSERWVSSLFSYSDLYGVEYKKNEIAMDSVYYHRRGGLGNYYNNIEKIKQSIDKGIAEKSWTVFYFHDGNEINTETMAAVLDYVNQKIKSGELKAVTYKEMYEKNAGKESVIRNTNSTYYVSSTGTSLTGTDKNHPMSYETAKSKTYVSGDTILFKRGDTFYGAFNPKINTINDKTTTISAYGTGALPNICGYKIADKKTCWRQHSSGIYQIQLGDKRYFSGVQDVDANSVNIGFIQDKNGKKYFNKKGSLGELKDQYDFYCDNTYLYIKSDKNPYEALGTLKLATRTNLLYLHSNMKVENLNVSGTGAHGVLGCDATTENVELVNNVIEDIGGSYLKGTTRYGNGIEFYGTNTKNVTVKNNIIRNTYDVGFTIQGNAGSGRNVIVEKNVFVSNSHDSEIWENGYATGVKGYEFRNNISINLGRGWGYDARPDKYASAHILFWGYGIEDTDIYFHHNMVYNPIRVYFIEQSNKTDQLFKNKNVIRSDYNEYLLAKDAKIYRHLYNVSEKDQFVAEFKKDAHSTFTALDKVDDKMVKTAAVSDDIWAIKKLFGIEEEKTVNLGSEQKETDKKQTDKKQTEQGNVQKEPVKEETEKKEEPVKETEKKEEPVAETEKKEEPAQQPGESGTQQENPAGTDSQPSAPGVTVPEAGTRLTSTETQVVYEVKKADQGKGTVKYVKSDNTKTTKITVPATVKIDNITYKVTEIAPKALKNNKKVTKITLGKNVTTIGDEAFANCKAATKITLSANVTTIGKNAFKGCSKIKTVTLPAKVKSIGANTFKDCKNLKTITIKSKKLTSKNVSKNAFSGISSKVTIKVPKSKVKAYGKLFREKGLSKKVKVKAI